LLFASQIWMLSNIGDCLRGFQFTPQSCLQ
jgi:hypothetical protein